MTIPPHPLRSSLLCGCVLLLAFLVGVSRAAAAEDIEPPVLTSLSISPLLVDTASSAQVVTVTAHITDNLSGVRFATVAFFSPKGQQGEEPNFVLVSGSDTDGVYEAQVPIPQFVEPGTWKARIRLTDFAGNVSELNQPELEAGGFPSTLEVEGLTQDTEPPVLTGLSISPLLVDTASSAQVVTVTAHITDNLSGVRFATVAFFSPKGQQGEEPNFVLVSGSDTDGVYEAQVPIPQFVEPGTWKARIRLTDFAGNVSELNQPELEAGGFPSTLEVEGLTQDTEPPVLTGLSISPSSVDTASSAQMVTVTAHIADNLSGVRFANVVFFSPEGRQGENINFTLVSGTDTEGVYEAQVPFAQFSEAGTWKAQVRLTDNVGNVAEIDQAELEADGFPATVGVEDGLTDDSHAPAAQVPLQGLTTPPFLGADIAGASLVPTASGTVSINVDCPAEEGCAGTVTLRVPTAVVANATRRQAGKRKVRLLTLAVGSFVVPPGRALSTVRLHLSSRGRRLLSRTRVLHAQATVVAHDSAGAALTTQAAVTLRLPEAKRHSHTRSGV